METQPCQIVAGNKTPKDWHARNETSQAAVFTRREGVQTETIQCWNRRCDVSAGAPGGEMHFLHLH